MPAHEFGIIGSINKDEDYGSNYCPQKYNCIPVDDDVILPLMKNLNIMKTYYHNLSRPEFGLAYYGITLIPPNSLNYLQDVLLKVKSNNYSSGLNELIAMISIALEKNKYIIHYGI